MCVCVCARLTLGAAIELFSHAVDRSCVLCSPQRCPATPSLHLLAALVRRGHSLWPQLPFS